MAEIVMRVNVNVDESDFVKVTSCIVLSHGNKKIMSGTLERKMSRDNWNDYEENATKKVVTGDIEYFKTAVLEMINTIYMRVEDEQA